jgi:hypothetical protein
MDHGPAIAGFIEAEDVGDVVWLEVEGLDRFEELGDRNGFRPLIPLAEQVEQLPPSTHGTLLDAKRRTVIPAWVAYNSIKKTRPDELLREREFTSEPERATPD